jgi:integrase
MAQASLAQFPNAFKNDFYTAEEKAHFERSKLADKIIKRKGAASAQTAKAYGTALRAFAAYVLKEYKKELDVIVNEVIEGKHDPYDMLGGFAASLVNPRANRKRVSPNTVRYWTVLSKKFLRLAGAQQRINNDDFKELVTLPRMERSDKEAIERKDVIEILNACSDIELKTAVMMLASTGGRSMEVFSLRVKDVDLTAGTVTFRKEFSKMRQARTRPLTHEMRTQLQVWLKHKYRAHRTTIKDAKGKQIQEPITPESRPDDLLFGPWHADGQQPLPRSLATRMRHEFGQLLRAIEKDTPEDGGNRRAITLHSFRRFTKTAISNQGYGDYSEWMIGHNHGGMSQTYYRASKKESAEIFAKLEPALTFTDATRIESLHADISAKLEQKDIILNATLEQNKMLINMLVAKGVLAAQDAEKLAAPKAA